MFQDNADRLALHYTLLAEEVRALRDKLSSLGADMTKLTDDDIQSASHAELRLWHQSFDRLVRTLSAGGRD